tara:strand:- start:32 stop:565 length:534 start_codon:yes stop_codon:yes gene_type:complete
MKNILIELPIWATKLNSDWIPECNYSEHLLEMGDAGSSENNGQHLPFPKEVHDSILAEADKFWLEYGLNPESKPLLLQAWSNRHGKGGWTDWHHHGPCELSAVWYPKFKPGNGNLVFRNPLDMYQGKERRYDEPLIEVPLEEKDLIIFPAFLLHKTQVNELDEDRIVVSMNFGWTPR